MAYEATITGGLIGGAIALGFWAVTFTGLDRRHPGFIGSFGLLTMLGLCLWFDGWIAVAVAGFCIALPCLLLLGGGGRGPRRARPAPDARLSGAPAAARRVEPWGFGPLSSGGAHRPLGAARSSPN